MDAFSMIWCLFLYFSFWKLGIWSKTD